MKEYNLPYDQLELLGLSIQDVDQLPEKFRQQLKDGQLTDVIVANIKTDNGDTVIIPMRLRMTTENGKDCLMTYPSLREFSNDLNLNDRQLEALATGQILHIEDQYIQRDPQTNCIIKVSEKELYIEQKFAEIEKVKDIELGTEQKNQLKNGKPVLLDVGGEQVVVGLDLKSPDYYKTLKGDFNEWEYNKKVEYDILHPEYIGVVKTDENRWEYQQIVNSERFPQSLQEKPRMAKNASMSM